VDKTRRLGDILLDIEDLIQEAVDSHSLRLEEVLNLLHTYLQDHYPNFKKVNSTENQNMAVFYGPKEKWKSKTSKHTRSKAETSHKESHPNKRKTFKNRKGTQ
jgi:hypothetical protein